MSSYLGNLGTTFSQSLNTVLGGHPDESISARAHRLRPTSLVWAVVAALSDTLFLWEPNHCENAYWSDIRRAGQLLAMHKQHEVHQ